MRVVLIKILGQLNADTYLSPVGAMEYLQIDNFMNKTKLCDLIGGYFKTEEYMTYFNDKCFNKTNQLLFKQLLEKYLLLYFATAEITVNDELSTIAVHALCKTSNKFINL